MDITLTRQNKRICGRMYLPADGSGKYPLVIFCHGLGGNFRELEHYGPVLAESGIACFLFDFCGGGPESLSSGAFADMSVLTEQADLDIVLDEMKCLPYVCADQIFLMGESQGGFVAARAAAERGSEIAGLILWYPAFVISEDAKRRKKLAPPEKYDFFGLTLGERYLEDALKTDIYSDMREYEGSVRIIHGDRDELVPISASEQAVRMFPHAELRIISGGRHGFEGGQCAQAIGLSVEAIKSVLKGKAVRL